MNQQSRERVETASRWIDKLQLIPMFIIERVLESA